MHLILNGWLNRHIRILITNRYIYDEISIHTQCNLFHLTDALTFKCMPVKDAYVLLGVLPGAENKEVGRCFPSSFCNLHLGLHGTAKRQCSFPTLPQSPIDFEPKTAPLPTNRWAHSISHDRPDSF